MHKIHKSQIYFTSNQQNKIIYWLYINNITNKKNQIKNSLKTIKKNGLWSKYSIFKKNALSKIRINPTS